MKNVSKILCVVLALVIALSAASCSLGKQYAYKKGDVELPIGVYIYYLQSAYSQAQNYAQQSDKYDSATGKYDGKKSFLKMEIDVGEDDPVVAEDWIKDKAEENTKHAAAIMTKYNELGCTIDEVGPENAYTEINEYASYYGIDEKTTCAEIAKNYEQYGIGFDAWLLCEYSLGQMEAAVFEAEYGPDGPSEVSDKEITDELKDKYTSYKLIYVNLYTQESSEADGSSETETTNTPLPDDEIKKYMEAFDSYASTLSDGGSFDEVVDAYAEEFEVDDATATQYKEQSNVEIIGDDETSEVKKAIKDMKDGQAMTLEIGDDDTSKQLYLVYREKIENQFDAYTKPAVDNEKKLTILKDMKSEEFNDMLEELAEDIKLSSACKSYKPSMFEQKDSKKSTQ